MIPFRTQVKFYFENPATIETAAFAAVFQRWIQQNALNELLIDVADYRHVFEGPGIMLLGHASDYAIESRAGRLGLIYTRKRQSDADLPTQLRTSFQMALAACELLEAEPSFEPRLKFRADEIEIRFADRLQLPNRAETFDLIKADVTSVLTDLYGGKTPEFAPAVQDPRYMFSINVRNTGVSSISELVYRYQPSAET